MFLLYHALVIFLLPLICVFLLFKVARRRDYLARFSDRLGFFDAQESGGDVAGRAEHCRAPRFWLHAVSAGEAVASLPLLAALRRNYPQSYLAVSTATPAGRQILAASSVALDRIFYCPLDFFWIVRRVAAKIAPTIFVLVETDLWPALLQCLAARGVPILLLNGRISERRMRSRWLFRRVFCMIDHLCVQTAVDAERARSIGIRPDKISVTGNLKFAQALSQLDLPPITDTRYALPAGAFLLIAGSTHPGEEEELLECYRQLRARGRTVFLMIAPRHLERLDNIATLVARHGYTVQKWSQFESWQDRQITIVDSVGNLPRLYSLADFVFVGGSFVKRGGHNILEPAAWGKAIFFGPFMENYSSIAESTVREGAAIRVGDGGELAGQIETLIENPGRAAIMGRKANAVVLSNQDVIEKDLALIEALIDPESRPQYAISYASAATRVLILLLAIAQAWL
jgi:3-deoxy-D-manno-octulosonic-acid transferase